MKKYFFVIPLFLLTLAIFGDFPAYADSNLPTINMSADTQRIVGGSASVIRWTTSNALSCTSSGGWSGSQPLNGSLMVTPQTTTGYTLTCFNGIGQTSNSVTILVGEQPIPLVNLTISIQRPENVGIISWRAVDTTNCIASNGWSGTKASQGSELITINHNTTYVLSCTNQYGQFSDSLTVLNNPSNQSQLPLVSLSVQNRNIQRGGSVLLSWNSSNAISCLTSGGWSGTRNVAGSEVATPTVTTTYQLTCTNSQGSASDSETIFVDSQYNPNPYNPNPSPCTYNSNSYSYITNSSNSCAQAITFTKTVRNTTTHEQMFQSNTQAQGLDVLEFELRLRNTNSFETNVSVHDSLPSDLFYVQGSTKSGTNGFSGQELSDVSTLIDGVTSANGISFTLRPYEERVLRFRAVVLFGTAEKTITNQADVRTTSSYTGLNNGNNSNYNPLTSQSTVTITIKNRGKVLGVGSVVTGPEDILPWTLVAGFFGALLLYAIVFKYRYRGKTFGAALADIRLQSMISNLKKKEGGADVS